MTDTNADVKTKIDEAYRMSQWRERELGNNRFTLLVPTLIRVMRTAQPRNVANNSHRMQQWRTAVSWVGNAIKETDLRFDQMKFEGECGLFETLRGT